MNLDDFNEALDPNNWQSEGTTLNTPTFQATIKPDGTLWVYGPALFEGFSVEATQSLTRFLSTYVTFPPEEPPYDFRDDTPNRVE